MRALTRTKVALAIVAVGAAPAVLWAQNAAQSASQAPRAGVIGTHQIDRYEAIRLLQESVRSNPGNEADWIILGELAHEVALDVSPDQDDQYYKMSREAYEKALALDPGNAGLKAAVQFAKEQEANAPGFDRARRLAANSYIEARRRELAQTRNMPTIQVYSAATAAAAPAQPAAAPAPAPAAPLAGSTAATAPPAAYYPAPVYRPFSSYQGQPLTYQQYASGYMPPAASTAAPMTLRQFSQQLPGTIMNQAIRGIGPR